MPMYTYVCHGCGEEVERITSYELRDRPEPCDCGGQLERGGPEPFRLGQPAYQCGAVFQDQEGKTHKVPGHFGKDAKRDKLRRKPRQ